MRRRRSWASCPVAVHPTWSNRLYSAVWRARDHVDGVRRGVFALRAVRVASLSRPVHVSQVCSRGLRVLEDAHAGACGVPGAESTHGGRATHGE